MVSGGGLTSWVSLEYYIIYIAIFAKIIFYTSLYEVMTLKWLLPWHEDQNEWLYNEVVHIFRSLLCTFRSHEGGNPPEPVSSPLTHSWEYVWVCTDAQQHTIIHKLINDIDETHTEFLSLKIKSVEKFPVDGLKLPLWTAMKNWWVGKFSCEFDEVTLWFCVRCFCLFFVLLCFVFGFLF